MASRYRIYPTEDQQCVLRAHCADVRYVWNLALEQFNHYDRRWPARRLSFLAQRRQLKDVRAGSFLAAGSSSVQQVALQDFEQACKNWWSGSHRRPTFRKRGRHEGFCVRDVRIKQLNVKWASVHVPKCGYVRFRLSGPLLQKHGMARVTLDSAGRWHVSFSAPQQPVDRQQSGRMIGLDLGIAQSLTTSDGQVFQAPQAPEGERTRRLRLERRLARQQKGSSRREATKFKLAKLKARQADRLKDWREKASTDLVRGFDLIAVENLRVGNMLRSARGSVETPGNNVRAKAGLNREISAQGWSALLLRIEQKAAASDVAFVKVSAINTSRTCCACGHSSKENRKSQATFSCASCGHIEHADINAAKNILAAGLAVSGRGGSVRPAAASAVAGRPGEASTTEVAIAA